MTVGSTNTVRPITQADLDAHSEQALIELVYVRTANEILGDSLAALQDAVSVTKDVLDTLTGLQTLHNRVEVNSKGNFSFNYADGSGGIDNYRGRYTSAASAFFGGGILPVFPFSSAGASGFAQFQSDLIALRDKLVAQIPRLSATTPTLSGGGEDPNSLLAKLRKVLSDLNANDLNTFSGVKAWTLDKYDVSNSTLSSQAGLIQQNLTFAITAGESLNDTQKESVRRYLFVFEEYYKSASAVLQKITQLIEKMAQGISR